MVASKHGFPLVHWAVVVCSYDDVGTQGLIVVSIPHSNAAVCEYLRVSAFGTEQTSQAD